MIFRRWMYIGVLILISTPLWAQNMTGMDSKRRVALVIGNAAYTENPLQNAVNDAQGFARVLRNNLGFEVIELINGNHTAMQDSINKFEELIQEEVEVALFYFSGHGLQARAEDQYKNYMVPIDARVERESQVPAACISADWVLRILEKRKGNRVNLIILDACRNNPFDSRSFRTKGGQGVRGLAEMHAPSGSLIAYAAAPGKQAWDGEDDEGNYSPLYR